MSVMDYNVGQNISEWLFCGSCSQRLDLSNFWAEKSMGRLLVST